jgi:hypothetical protein
VALWTFACSATAALNVDTVSASDLEDPLVNGIRSCIPGRGDLADLDLNLCQNGVREDIRRTSNSQLLEHPNGGEPRAGMQHHPY